MTANVKITDGVLPHGARVSGTYPLVDTRPRGAPTKRRLLVVYRRPYHCWVKLDEQSRYEIVSATPAKPASRKIEKLTGFVREAAQVFADIGSFCDGLLSGTYHSIVVAGPGGVGKTVAIQERIALADVHHRLNMDNEPRRVGEAGQYRSIAGWIKGSATPAGCYDRLWEYSEPCELIVMDDVDAMLRNPEMLGSLKAALDTTSPRIISWQSRNALTSGAPKSFNYRGACAFLTNLNLRGDCPAWLRPHRDPVLQRIDHYFDLYRLFGDGEGHLDRAKLFFWTEYVMREQGGLDRYSLHDYSTDQEIRLDKRQVAEIWTYYSDNLPRWREVSPRAVALLAKSAINDPGEWRRHSLDHML